MGTSNTIDRPIRDKQPTDRFGYSANMIISNNEDGKPEVINFMDVSRDSTHQNQGGHGALSHPEVHDSED